MRNYELLRVFRVVPICPPSFALYKLALACVHEKKKKRRRPERHTTEKQTCILQLDLNRCLQVGIRLINSIY